jgi:hypothetical protein
MEETANPIEECIELKNLKYKTMLLTKKPIQETKTTNNLSNLEKFLEEEKNINKSEPWCKLNKTDKTKKIIDYVDIYKTDNNLDQDESDLLTIFLKDCLERNKLKKVKDVVYDNVLGIVKEIPSLHYTKENKHFTLKNMEKRMSTLKSLSVKKSNSSTIKNKNI